MYDDLLEMNIEEIENIFKKRGEGSSRKIYSNKKIKGIILKYAYNKKGLEQNATEYNIYTNLKNKYGHILRPILACSKKIVIAKKALPLESLLQQTLRPFEYDEIIYFSIFDILKEKKVQAILSLNYLDIYKFKNEVKKLILESDLLEEDIKRVNSWGLINDKLVLIDYGCTNNIFCNLYGNNKKTCLNNRFR